MKSACAEVYTGETRIPGRKSSVFAHRPCFKARPEVLFRNSLFRGSVMAAPTIASYPLVSSAPAEAPREYPKKIVIRSHSHIFLQTVSEIDYLTAAANYVHIHAAGQVFRIRSTIQAIEQRLDPQKFGRVHRCTIVNFERVKEVRPLQRGDFMLSLSDSSQLKMSRRHRDKLEIVQQIACAAEKHLVKYGSAGKENGSAAAAAVGGRGSSLLPY
jgi:hypothetical protein